MHGSSAIADQGMKGCEGVNRTHFFMMVLVLFQLIFLNNTKTKSTSCRDLSPNRPFQELNNITI